MFISCFFDSYYSYLSQIHDLEELFTQIFIIFRRTPFCKVTQVRVSIFRFRKIIFDKELSINNLKTLLAFNSFFAINCLFAFNEGIYETYNFQHQLTNTNEKTTYIHLENSKYNNQPWFRTFFDYDAMVDKNKITYTFKNGCLGLRVLVNSEFE